MDDNKQELLEIYKLHAELADRVSQRRDSANRLYVGLLTGVLVFLAAVFRFGEDPIPTWMALVISVLGIVLSVSWFIVINSYRQLNTGKFAMLDELEDKMAYPAFRREWDILEKGENKRRYWKLTIVETLLPITFGIFFIIWPLFYYL